MAKHLTEMTPTDKTCTRCHIEKPIEEFYGTNRSHCATCERTEASKRMRDYNSTFRGKASQALQTAGKAVKRVEAEGVKVTDTLTLHEVLQVLSDKECAYCSEEVAEKDRTLDHITPMRYGGGNTFDNMTMACRTCNSVKNDLPLIAYMIQHETESEQALQLFNTMASRGGRTFAEVFERLSEEAKTYYEYKAAEAITKIKGEEVS